MTRKKAPFAVFVYLASHSVGDSGDRWFPVWEGDTLEEAEVEYKAFCALAPENKFSLGEWVEVKASGKGGYVVVPHPDISA